MKYRSLIITLLLSSIFLSIITCVWKIMATLQGLSFTTLNFNLNFLLALGLITVSIILGNKFKPIYKISILSILFTIIYTFLNESSPLWFSIGIFFIILFFTNKFNKYDIIYLRQDFISEKIIFEFLSLFAIVFFCISYIISVLYNVCNKF